MVTTLADGGLIHSFGFLLAVKIVAILLVFLGLLKILQRRTLAPRLAGTGPKVNPGIALIALAIGGWLNTALGMQL